MHQQIVYTELRKPARLREGAPEPLISVEAVDFSYEKHRVLSGCSFEIEPGELVMLVGDNGVGKSTLMKLILGELSPQKGTIRLLGQNPRSFKSWKKIGYVPQSLMEGVLNFPATVTEVVETGLYAELGLFRLLTQAQKQRIQEALEKTGIAELAHKSISELSGGQRQRVMLSRALVGNPCLLLLDEPSAALDAEGTETLFALLKKTCAEEGVAALVITHDLEHAGNSGARLLHLHAGHADECVVPLMHVPPVDLPGNEGEFENCENELAQKQAETSDPGAFNPAGKKPQTQASRALDSDRHLREKDLSAPTGDHSVFSSSKNTQGA